MLPDWSGVKQHALHICADAFEACIHYVELKCVKVVLPTKLSTELIQHKQNRFCCILVLFQADRVMNVRLFAKLMNFMAREMVYLCFVFGTSVTFQYIYYD